VSFDVYLQDFADEPHDRGDAVRAILEPWYEDSTSSIVTADGSADVFGLDEHPLLGLMFNGVDGRAAWDVIYETAVVGGWVVLPVGCPVCVVSQEQIATIPDELRASGAELVHSGADILRVVTGR
jgi:hypothetical protein